MIPRHLATLFAALLFGLSLSFFGLPAQGASKHHHGLQTQPFGTQDGRPITLYTLTNSHGLEVRTMNYGAIILSMRLPDRKGQLANIVLGHNPLQDYIPNLRSLEAVAGRYDYHITK